PCGCGPFRPRASTPCGSTARRCRKCEERRNPRRTRRKTNEMHAANRRYWDALAPRWEALRERDELWQRIPQEPGLAFDGGALELIEAFLGDLHGKQAVVIGSGDNYAAFALAGLGARVTSV